MRPVDLARPHGLSGQAVRNYEAAGILPAADRTATGYRRYTDLHAAALRTFLALVPAHGHDTARTIMVLLNTGRSEEALTAIDHSHADLLADRLSLDSIERALTELTGAPDKPQARRDTTIGALAHRFGVRPATLRRWERAGLLRPDRDRATGYRTYTADDIRDAMIVHQLRRSGYLLAQIQPLLRELRNADAADSPAAVAAAIADRRHRLHTRALAMLQASAEIGRYIRGLGELGELDEPDRRRSP